MNKGFFNSINVNCIMKIKNFNPKNHLLVVTCYYLKILTLIYKIYQKNNI